MRPSHEFKQKKLVWEGHSFTRQISRSIVYYDVIPPFPHIWTNTNMCTHKCLSNLSCGCLSPESPAGLEARGSVLESASDPQAPASPSASLHRPLGQAECSTWQSSRWAQSWGWWTRPDTPPWNTQILIMSLPSTGCPKNKPCDEVLGAAQCKRL